MEHETRSLRDGRSVLIRDGQVGDGALFHDYLAELGASTEYMLTHPGDMSMAGVYEKSLEKIEAGGFYALNAFDTESGAMVGNAALYFGERVKLSHVAGLAMGVLPEWQGNGLGMWMLERAVQDIKRQPKIQRLQLVVMEGNEHAKKMYERAGFVHEGRKVKAVRQPDGSYRDEFLMGMWVGD
tara:strand:- start:85965 stop:86513 length:549 start_codon:yes stop_codon:yes gene_type:complete